MNIAISFEDVREEDRSRVGGKFHCLAGLAREGMVVPEAVCITVDAYRQYLASTRIGERIHFELHRKGFEEMRWEELWDASLRIRNLFLNNPLPKDLREAIAESIETGFSDKTVSVRSSSLAEDSQARSFAGLHESYVNIRGGSSILEHIRLVWASLWSDRALLYRQELGLDVERSAMAVVVQEMVAGERSGVAFTRSPTDPTQAVIEAVHGLNQGLVDGTVEPDRWILDRESGVLISHHPVRRDKMMVPASNGVHLADLPPEKRDSPPLEHDETGVVYSLARRAESRFGSPQDVEWTIHGDTLYALQSRPITTTGGSGAEDERSWYLSQHRSLENLKALRRKIVEEDLPAMEREAETLAAQDLAGLSDADLVEEIEGRNGIFQKWKDVYWRDCIPFAHGMRLFGMAYNDAMHPTDPFEFVDPLRADPLMSTERNRLLREIASMLRDDPTCAAAGNGKDRPAAKAFQERVDAYLDRFGELASMASTKVEREEVRRGLIRLLEEMASMKDDSGERRLADGLELADRFLDRFEGDERAYAVELLDLGRASYKLRDDDNIYLGGIKGQLDRSIEEGIRRIGPTRLSGREEVEVEEVLVLLSDPGFRLSRKPPIETKRAEEGLELKGRQLTGQPAGPGIVSGKARVVEGTKDLFDFKSGEVLVCDAVDPTMTFIVPLAAGIVERRGGMLIHGAIIAREYGLPCVTGVPDATALIPEGSMVTVDGFNGIVVIHGIPATGKETV